MTDRRAVEAEEEARFEFREWQGESLGSLRSEQEVRAHFNLSPDDKAYLGYIDGRLVYFQYHVPFEGGMERLTPGNIQSTMDKHKARLVQRSTDHRMSMEDTD